MPYNPRSLQNIAPRKPGVKNRTIRASDSQWQQLEAIALALGISKRDGVSGLLQAIGGDGYLQTFQNSVDDLLDEAYRGYINKITEPIDFSSLHSVNWGDLGCVEVAIAITPDEARLIAYIEELAPEQPVLAVWLRDRLSGMGYSNVEIFCSW